MGKGETGAKPYWKLPEIVFGLLLSASPLVWASSKVFGDRLRLDLTNAQVTADVPSARPHSTTRYQHLITLTRHVGFQ